MPTVFVNSLDDPRVALYRNLKDHELDRRGRFFIAEGEHLLRRLLASEFEIESVLMSDRRVEELSPLVGDRAPIFVVPQSLMHDIVGMKFHSGVMAAGRRKGRATIDAVIPKNRENLLLVICPEIANVENIGSLIRLSAGFGAD